ncbi:MULTISPECIES: hypothetical protein [Exiguobacterium]|uniref:Uncharacterized protein n=1 Tax=Exiguobacterium antarcticum TaxID=132920 RepID=A0ABT6R546_9BACL|nr:MULTISPECIES: hypothetical protein [Exiguobacterium]MCT4781081.1 hypothetical protein [Exiguobacterium soli]MDI3235930.1 hypothetical protein [Exiguobacterium antarcticum]
MIISLSTCYEEARTSAAELQQPVEMTREQLRQAVSVYDPFVLKEPCLLQQLIRQEMILTCRRVQSLGLPLESAPVKLLIVSSFNVGAGFNADEINQMSPETIKRQLTTNDVVFARFIQHLFLHQTQRDIICQRLMTILAGASAKKSFVRAERLQASWTVLR